MHNHLESGMSTSYIVTSVYHNEPALQDEIRPRHLAYLHALVESGLLVASGPWGPEEEPGGIWLIRADTKTEAQAMVDADPFMSHGLVASVQIRAWKPLLGPLAPTIGGSK